MTVRQLIVLDGTQLAESVVSFDDTTGVLSAPQFAGAGGGITSLNASALSSGIVPESRLPTTLLKVNGDGSQLTNLNASALANGTVPDARIPSGIQRTTGSGANLTNLDASALATGTVPDARLPTSIVRTTGTQTISGDKTFNNFIVFGMAGWNMGDLVDLGQTNRAGVTAWQSTDLGSFAIQGKNAMADNTVPFRIHRGTTPVMRVLGSGNIQNANNVYGSTSDGDLKQDIEDMGPQTEDLLALRPRKYRMIADVERGIDLKQAGLIGQETRLVCPGLVDTDDKGNLWIKYSILPIKLLKGFQEIEARIRALEAAA